MKWNCTFRNWVCILLRTFEFWFGAVMYDEVNFFLTISG